jgi:ethanolamine utilization microcompartment shell protein EutS
MEAKEKMVDLRAYFYLDKMQPQVAAYIGSTAFGFLPIAGVASLFIEVRPGMAINNITDLAVKKADVKPAMQIVERQYGLLEIHSETMAEVVQAGSAILEGLGLQERDRFKPKVLSTRVITRTNDYHCQLINRTRGGSMLLAGQTLFILEVEPAAYAALAANEGEKSTDVTLIEMRPYGASGRVYLAGTEANIEAASKAAIQALESLDGREMGR